MPWKTLLVAVLLTPPVAFVGNELYAGEQPVEERPALVLERGDGVPDAEPRVTLRPSATGRPDADRDDDVDDDVGDGDDDGVRIVRPAPQGADDGDGGDDGDDGDRDDGSDDDTDDAPDDAD